jgi:acyl-CoA synthetase (AMP-forming)/AMP-acid ligase II
MTAAVNIAETFVEVARQYPSKTAIIEAKTARSISFSGLDGRANAFAHYFSARGVEAGDIVILMVTPSIDFICLSLALFKIGTPIVLIDPGMGYKNLLRCIERVAPKFLVGIPKAILFARLCRKSFASVQKFFCCGTSFGLLGANILSVAGNSSKPFAVYSPATEDLAAIIFTTGSTGPPKGVRYEHSIFAAQLELIKKYYQIGTEDVDQPAFPLFALFSAALGACSVIPDMDATKPAQVDPVKFIDSIERYRVSYSFGSPAIWNAVSKYCAANDITLTSVKKVLMAGAPVAYELLARVKSILPQSAEVYTPYGATESLPIVSIESREVIEQTSKESRLGRGTCVGRALPGIDIKIIKISDTVIDHFDHRSELAAGEIGEIIVRGPVVTRGYMNNLEETRLAKITDDQRFWHRMGDVGYLDKAGRLWFCGRKAHRVVTRDTTYYSIPCEAILNEHPLVYRSALVAVKNYRNRVEPALIAEPLETLSAPGELLGELRQLAAKNQGTKAIKHFLLHPDFPVDIRHNAKIFREKLAEWAQQKIYPQK